MVPEGLVSFPEAVFPDCTMSVAMELLDLFMLIPFPREEAMFTQVGLFSHLALGGQGQCVAA